jgi:hypothetical protein
LTSTDVGVAQIALVPSVDLAAVTPFGEVVKTISDSGGLREVRIVRNADGTFGFEEWSFETRWNFWVRAGELTRTITDSAESAEREARTSVVWLIGAARADDDGAIE